MIDETMKKKLCLLLDEDADQSEGLGLLRQIERNPDAREQYRRYCIASHVLRSGPALIPDRGFADRVSAALAEEPTILAPAPVRKRPLSEKAVTVALAASIAMMAVLVAKSLQDYSPLKGRELLALSDLMGSNVQSTQAAMTPEFRDYLVSHYETAYLSGVHGMLPAVRLVSAEPAR